MTAFFKEVVSLWGLGSYALFLGLLLVGGHLWDRPVLG